MSANVNGREKLPEEFRPCFWDYDFDSLDLEHSKLFIIARLYTKGGIRGLGYVERHYSLEEIAEAARKRRDLNMLVANYLRQKCGLKKEEMAFYRVPEIPGHDLWRQ